MRFLFRSGRPAESVQFVKGMLSLIGDVREFEVFRSDQETTHIVAEDGRRVGYTFMLKDDRSNELWLDTICGSASPAARATEEILQLLGLKQEYQVQRRHWIRETALRPVHRICLLVGEPDDQLRWVSHFWACMEYPSAHLLFEATQAVRILGYLSCARARPDVVIPEAMQALAQPYEWDQYATIRTLTIAWSLRFRLSSHEQMDLLRLIGRTFQGRICFPGERALSP